jgi:hypothetical protein
MMTTNICGVPQALQWPLSISISKEEEKDERR